jgi:hypothetical protein
MKKRRLPEGPFEKLCRHRFDVDAYLADGGLICKIPTIGRDTFQTDDALLQERTTRIAIFFQRADAFDPSVEFTEEMLRGIWAEVRATPIATLLLEG